MVDLTHAKWRPNRYGGSEKKRTLLFDGKIYMVKFPEPPRSKKTSVSYIGNQFSEHIGCQLFQALQIPAQNTFLAKYCEPVTGKEKIVVACEDFCRDGSRLLEFSKIGHHDTGSDKTYTTTIEDVYEIIERFDFPVNKFAIKKHFWNMFVVDALLGNPDRHLDNWGLLEDSAGRIEPAPVYDCGSSLSPLSSDERKDLLLKDENLMKIEEYNLCSVYRHQGKRIFYHEILKAPLADLHRSILEIVPRIKLAAPRIDALIDATEEMTDISKAYMKKSLAMRLNQMLLPALKKAQERQAREDGESRSFSR